MKKCSFTSLFLAVILLFSLSVPVAAGLADDMEVAATAAILVEGDSGEILYEKNAREKRYPASLTKMMTTLLVLEEVDRGGLRLDQTVTATQSALSGLSPSGSNQNIRAEEQMTVRDLLYCVMLASANDACNVLAETVAGSVENFVTRMNERGREIGMTGTHFANAHGFHDPEHYTTACDLVLLAMEAMKHPLFREIVGTVDYYVPETNLHAQRHFYTTNGLLSNWHYLGYTYRYATGIKTGTTDEAGQCLASSATKGERTLFCVVLGAKNVVDENGKVVDRPSFSESKRLMEWGFDNFSRRTLLSTTDLQGQLPVTLSKTEHVVLAPAGELEAMVPKDVTTDDLVVTPSFFVESVEAPVQKGQVLGKVTVSYNGREYGSLDLVALNDVERDAWMYRLYRLTTLFESVWVKIGAALLVLLILVLVVLQLFMGHRNRRRRNYRGRRYRRRK